MQNREAICQGAQGFIVERLQRGLFVTRDGAFGPKTRRAVEDLQDALGYAVTGRADADVFDAARVEWPSVFERCLMITAAFEGTGFGGVNKRDIDGAGVTLGIVGFTTLHGEVQRLITEYIRANPAAVDELPAQKRGELLILAKSAGRNADVWERWFYGGDGKVDDWLLDIIAKWGDDEVFRRIQLAMICAEMWEPVKSVADDLEIESAAGKALLFDVQVQNGGFRERHQEAFEGYRDAGASVEKAVALAVADECNPKWRDDVLCRKMLFVDGKGDVHGERFYLEDYGL